MCHDLVKALFVRDWLAGANVFFAKHGKLDGADSPPAGAVECVLRFHLSHGKTECADGGNNSKRFHGDVSGHRYTVPSFNSASKSGDDVKVTSPLCVL
jgi:hypothetical protein